MTNEITIAVTEDQAKKLEDAGFPVRVEYTARLNDFIEWVEKSKAPIVRLSPDSAPVIPPQPKLTIRRTHWGPSTTLRWTGLTYSGRKGTQESMAYDMLATHFSKPNPGYASQKARRSDISRVLSDGFHARGQVFSSSVISGLIRQKYLEVVKS